MKKRECSYCKETKENVSEMLSNGYYICEDCSVKSWGKKLPELETMKQKSEKEINQHQYNKGVEVTRENIHRYHIFMSNEEIEKLDFNIVKTERSNILVRNEDVDEFVDSNGRVYAAFEDNIPKDSKKRYAVEYCSTDTNGVFEYGIDFEYFDSEEQALAYIKETVLIPAN